MTAIGFCVLRIELRRPAHLTDTDTSHHSPARPAPAPQLPTWSSPRWPGPGLLQFRVFDHART
eukprot:5849621-Prymnesium_polylepis.1